MRVVCIHSARPRVTSALDEAAGALYETACSMNHARFFQHQLDDITQSIWAPFALEFYSSSNIVHPCFVGSDEIIEHLSTGVYAWMEGCEIEDSPDYTKQINEQTMVVGMELRLIRPDIYPIKFNGEFLTSTLAPVLTALSQTTGGERLLIQTIVQPLADTWWQQVKLFWSRKQTIILNSVNPRIWLRNGFTEDSLSRIQTKCMSPLFAVNIRISAFTDLDSRASPDTMRHTNHRLSEHVKRVASATQQFNRIDENGFTLTPIQTGSVWVKKVQCRSFDRPFRLSANELAGFFNPPSAGTLPNGPRVLSRKGPPPIDLPRRSERGDCAIFGHTNYRGHCVPFGINQIDRQQHMHILGKSGSGKSSLLKLLVRNEIEHGMGCAVLDPNGNLVDDLLEMIPRHRATDVVLFDTSDEQFVPCFNPFEPVRPNLQSRAIMSFIDSLRHLFKDQWCERMDHIARYAMLGSMHVPGISVLTLRQMLTDGNFRRSTVQRAADEHVKRFWLRDFPARRDEFEEGPIARLITLLDDLLSTPTLRTILTQGANLLNFREMIDSRKIVLLKVSKDTLGSKGADMVSSLLVWKIYEAAMSRADVSPELRLPFSLYIDEFDRFANESFREILSEARKYWLSLTVAHQHLEQLSKSVKNALFGNVANFLTFGIGTQDAPIVAGELAHTFDTYDILNLPLREFYLKMCINGEAQQAFSGRTLNIEHLPPHERCIDEVVKLSKARYCVRKKREGHSSDKRNSGSVPRSRAPLPSEFGTLIG